MLNIVAQRTPFTLLAERDMDLLVIEEMHASEPFRDWLVAKLYNNTRKIREFVGAYHTFTLDPLGSVDIMFVFIDVSGRKCAILIENKIDQPKQNLQAQRYFEFGEKGVEEGGWDEYLTCLFSPQAYFSSLEPSEYFSSYLSYEEIEEWFKQKAVPSNSATPGRAAYKIKLVRKAIEQGTGVVRQQQRPAFRAAAPQPTVPPIAQPMPQPAVKQQTIMAQPMPQPVYQPAPAAIAEPAPEPPAPKKKASASDFRVFPGGVFNLPAGYREAEDTIVGQFWTDCLAFANQKYPDLGMQRPTGSAEEAAWVEMTPDAFPREVKIIHKMPQGFMDLTFAMTSLAMIQAPYQRFMDSDMTFKESGKAAVIRINVPTIDPQLGFAEQRELVAFALQKAAKLYQLYLHVVGGSPTGYAPEELYL